jgi:hypothetical protein
MKAAKQKPNDVCACGSAKKFKKCCGAGGGVVGGASAPGGGGSSSLEANRQQLKPLLQSALAASVTADWGSTLRRCERALRFAGDSLCAAGDASRCATAASGVLESVQQLLLLAASAHLHQKEHAAADECIARACVVATSPATFWARALTSLTHAAWRTERLLEDDERLTVLPPPSSLREMLGQTAYLYGLHGRFAEGVTTYDEALAALAHEEPGQARDLALCWLSDNQCCLLSSLARRARDETQRAALAARLLAAHNTASRALDAAERAGGRVRATEIAMRRAHIDAQHEHCLALQHSANGRARDLRHHGRAG